MGLQEAASSSLQMSDLTTSMEAIKLIDMDAESLSKLGIKNVRPDSYNRVSFSHSRPLHPLGLHTAESTPTESATTFAITHSINSISVLGTHGILSQGPQTSPDDAPEQLERLMTCPLSEYAPLGVMEDGPANQSTSGLSGKSELHPE